MQPDRGDVDDVKDLFSAEDIETYRLQLLDNARDWATNPLQINSHSQDGETSTAGVVSTIAERDRWRAVFRIASRELADPTANPGAELITPGVTYEKHRIVL